MTWETYYALMYAGAAVSIAALPLTACYYVARRFGRS